LLQANTNTTISHVDKTPVSKVLTLWSTASFGILQMPMCRGWHKFLVCRIPGTSVITWSHSRLFLADSFLRGDFLRLPLSKLAFLDVKDAFLAAILLYYFRLFERRLGSRRFACRLASSMLLSTALEVVSMAGLRWWFRPAASVLPSLEDAGIGSASFELSGVLAVGP